MDITRTVIDVVNSAGAGVGVSLAEVQAQIASWARAGNNVIQIPESIAQDIIDAAVTRVGPVTGRTQSQVSQQIRDEVRDEAEQGNTDRWPLNKLPTGVVTGLRKDPLGRLVADKNGEASDVVTIPTGDGGGSGGGTGSGLTPEQAQAIDDNTTNIRTNAQNITELETTTGNIGQG